jgi:hypothetical protein
MGREKRKSLSLVGTPAAKGKLCSESLHNYNVPGSNTVVPTYPRVIRSKTYSGYVKQRIIPNAIYNVIFV